MIRDQLKQFDALTVRNGYSDEVFERMLPFLTAYEEAAAKLRALPLGAITQFSVMLAGGTR